MMEERFQSQGKANELIESVGRGGGATSDLRPDVNKIHYNLHHLLLWEDPNLAGLGTTEGLHPKNLGSEISSPIFVREAFDESPSTGCNPSAIETCQCGCSRKEMRKTIGTVFGPQF